jgi:N-acetylmuramoyl-L-alanine amidase
VTKTGSFRRRKEQISQNQYGGRDAVFVSIHYNSARQEGAYGIETYYNTKRAYRLAGLSPDDRDKKIIRHCRPKTIASIIGKAGTAAEKKRKPFSKAPRAGKFLVTKRRITVYMYARLLTVLAFALVVPTMAATMNGVTFNVRQANGVDQYYRLEVPPNLPPAKPDTGKISQNEVPIVAVGWAAGLETTGGLTNLGADKPGGFYNASYVKVDSVQYQTGSLPYYLVQMNGKIGQTRQTFYAAVLEDGRVVRPTAINTPTTPRKMATRRHAKY